MIRGMSLSLSLGLSALFSSTAANAVVPATPTITPGGTWTGAQGTGFGTGYGSAASTLPQPSATVYGSGCDVAPTVHFSCFPGEDIAATDTIVVHSRHVDPAGIAFVEFQLEGGSTVQVNWQIKHPTINTFGFPIKLNFDGVGILKVRVVPVNGIEAVGYVFVRGIASGVPADAITFYVDPVNGNDSWDGKAATFVSGTNGPWKTLTTAISFNGILKQWNASGEANTIEASGLVLQKQYTLVVSGPGNATLNYDIGDNHSAPSGWAGRNKKKLIVKLAPGTTNVAISATARDTTALNMSWIEFRGIQFNIVNTKLLKISSNGVTDCNNPLRAFSIAFTQGSKIFDPAGSAGPTSFGYPKGLAVGEANVTQFFLATHPFTLAESTFDAMNLAGLFFGRNIRGNFCQFFQQFNSTAQSNSTLIDVRLRQTYQQETRAHDDYELTLTSFTPNSPVAGQTTLVFSGAGTMKGNTDPSWSLGGFFGRFVTGTAVGQGGKNQGAGISFLDEAGNTYSYPPNEDGTTALDTVGFQLVSADNTTKTVVVTGIPTPTVGDKFRYYYVGHPDIMQFIGTAESSGQVSNIGWVNVQVLGMTLTSPFLIQSFTLGDQNSGESVTVSSTGTSFTYSGTSVRPGDFLRNTTTGEYRRVNTASAGSGTLYDAFAANLSSVVCSLCRGPNRVAWSNVIIHKSCSDNTPGDWQFGGADFMLGPSTIIGKRSQGAGELILFETDKGRTSATNPCFGMRNVRFGSSILSGMVNNGSGSILPGFVSADADFHQIFGTKPRGAANDGAVTFPANYTSFLPVSGVTRKAQAADVLQCPWDIDGNPRTTASIVGAKVA